MCSNHGRFMVCGGSARSLISYARCVGGCYKHAGGPCNIARSCLPTLSNSNLLNSTNSVIKHSNHSTPMVLTRPALLCAFEAARCSSLFLRSDRRQGHSNSLERRERIFHVQLEGIVANFRELDNIVVSISADDTCATRTSQETSFIMRMNSTSAGTGEVQR